jgi:glycosyltransferase involved in cell wall biosynthesis
MLATLSRDPAFASTIPSKIQSYLACAKPIVAALDGEGAKIVNFSGAGIAVAAEDSQALAKAVLSIYNLSASEREAMGARGLRYHETHFARDHLLDKLDIWLEEIQVNSNE